MSDPMYVQSVVLAEPEVWQRDSSCNGCSRGEPVVAVLTLGKTTASRHYQPSGFEWRMCATCKAEFLAAVTKEV